MLGKEFRIQRSGFKPHLSLLLDCETLGKSLHCQSLNLPLPAWLIARLGPSWIEILWMEGVLGALWLVR